MILIIFELLICSSHLFSQSTGEISTDRPDRTESPDIIHRGFFQAEAGFLYERTKAEQESNISAYSFPDILMRYGLSDKTEVRLHTEFTTENSSISDNYRGMLPLEIGAKINLTEGNSLLPKTSFIFEIEIPGTAGKEKNKKHLSPGLTFLFKNKITENTDLSYNAGIKWDKDEKTKTGFYTLSFGVSPFSKTIIFIETFGFFTKGISPEISADWGVSFLLSKNSQFDISSGIGLTGSSADIFLGFGFSIRLPE